MRLKHVFLFLSMVSIAFSAPMEPAKSTLFILLDGMNPSNKGLLQDYCEHYENSEVWGKTGAAKYFQENVVNTKANVYSRSYKNPADAPSAMVSELAGHGNTAQSVNCKENLMVYDAGKKEFSAGSSKEVQISSIVDEALEHWFAGKLAEMNLPLPTSVTDKIGLLKNRDTWSGSANSYTPKNTYKADFADIDPFLYAWIKNYKAKNNNSDPTLETLKKERPDFLPSRYVFIANGMGGMVAREYIQGSEYQGDVDKILFINTPHEGTGFADQALLSKDMDYYHAHNSLGSALAFLIPVVTLVYVGSDYFVEDSIMSFTKTILQALGSIAKGSISGNFNDHYFEDYNVTDGALWYSAQDADKRDLLYNSIREDAKDSKVDTLIGRTQLLNSMGMRNTYSDPLYRIIYSYGMPSVGNGRRTRADFLFQKKYHVDEEHLNEQLIDVYKSSVKTFLLDTLGLKEDIVDAYSFQLSEFLRHKKIDIRNLNLNARFDVGVTDWILEHASDLINNEKMAKQILEGATDFAVGKAVDFVADNVVGALLEWIDLGGMIDDLPTFWVNLITVLEEIIPQNFQEKFVSAFISSYSPKYKGMEASADNCDIDGISFNPLKFADNFSNLASLASSEDRLKNCLAAGHKDMARGLINYSINFFEQGTYDVPSYSAYGGGVSLFKDKDVLRNAYPLHTMSTSDSDYRSYRNILAVDGAFESNRKLIDQGLKVVCLALSWTGTEIPCKIAKYATNIGFATSQMALTSVAFGEYGVLEQSTNMTFNASLDAKHGKEITLHSGSKRSISYSDMDEMLYEKPYMSLQMVSTKEGDVVKAYPLLLIEESSDGYGDIPEIVDYNQLNSVYTQRYIAKNGSSEGFDLSNFYAPTGPAENLKNKNLVTNEDYYAMSLKDVSYKNWTNGSITREISRKEMPAMIVKDEIKEYRFQIDDLRPDLIWQIGLDFNMDVQFYFERNGNGTWDSYIERNGKDRIYVDRANAVPPINEMGQFVFRPMYLADEANKLITDANKKFAHNKIQAEGPNLVTVSVKNVMDMSASHQFSFYYQATLPYLREGWPTYLQAVSSLDDIYITAANQGDPYEFTKAEVCLIKSDNGAYTPVPNSCVDANVNYVKKENNGAAWDQLWRMEAHLGDGFIKTNNVEDGNYILQWKLTTKDASNNTSTYNMNVSVKVDTKRPDLTLNLTSTNLSNTARDASWAKILNNDGSSLRKTRVFAIPDGSKDTVWLKSYDGTGVSEMNFGWGLSVGKLPQGKSKVYVQSVDYAEPNIAMGIILQDLYSDDKDTVNAAWQNILESDGVTFKNGINGRTLVEEIVIDNEAPAVDMGSVTTATVANSSKQCANCPAYTKNTGCDFVVNSAELLKLSFKLNNAQNNVAHDSVRVQIILTDTDQSIARTFVAMHDFKSNSTYEFVESDDSRIPDGKYSLSVVLVDETGNSFGNIELQKTVRIDRTLPVVNNVVPNEPVYASAADVDKATFTVSSSKLDVNKSSYACYQKLVSQAGESAWNYIGEVSADQMNDSKKVSVEYSMKNAGMTIVDGRYSTMVGCYDKSGNFSSNSGPFSIGFRYPVLTYPTSAVTGAIADDYIQIAGIAPNPIVPGGNIQTSEYKVEWRKVGDTDWSEKGVQSTGKLVSTLVNNLAIWDRTNLAAGDYEIRLSVRGCKDDTDAKCDWVSTVEMVTLDVLDPIAIANKPKITFALPVDQVPGGEEKIISSQMLGVDDGSEWSMEMKILVADPFDPTSTVVAKKEYLDSMIISPFGGKPSETLPQGLSIWQDKDEWTIKYVGKVEAAKNYSAPTLVLKYTHSSMEFAGSTKADNESFLYDDTTQFAPELDLNGVISPAYNYTSAWDLSNATAFELKFKTNEPFILDVSSVKDAYANMYCGATGDLCSKYFELLNKNFATLFVNTNSFRMNLPWNGLTSNEMYPGSDKAKVIAIATEKTPGNRVIVDSATWKLSLGIPEIVSDYDNLESQLVISSEKDSENSVVRLGEVGYEFGIAGRNANVTAVVKDPDGKVIKVLMNNEPCVAGSKKNAYSISWDGVSEVGFASIKPGQYTFEINAVDGNGNKAQPKIYPFKVVYAGHLIAAAESENNSDNGAVLVMDEAKPDDNGDLRYVGKPDYLLTADAEAQVLSEDKRELSYYWDWKGTQNPAFYRANRFSLGIRRQRMSFPVTLVTMMDTRQYYISYKHNYELRNRCQKHVINLRSVVFNYEDDGLYSEIMRISSGDGDHIVGWNEDEDVEYWIHFNAKIFSQNAYDVIKKRLGDKTSVSFCEDDNKSLKESFDDNFSEEENINVLLWHDSWEFKYKSDEKHLPPRDKEPGRVTSGCSISEENNYVCKDTVVKSYNPHQNMLSFAIEHVPGEPYFGNDDFECGFCMPWPLDDVCSHCSNQSSATEIFAKVTFRVNDSYWNPEFGYSNLANKYVRFDHTNKTLYKDENYFPICKTAVNFYDGMNWTHKDYYGMVTPFEVQRFSYNGTECPKNNPLQFPDEEQTGPVTPSRYQFAFMGVDNENKYNEEKYGKKVDFVATAIGSVAGIQVADVITTANDTTHVGTTIGYNGWLDPSIDFYVTARAKITEVVKQFDEVKVAYPYNKDSFAPILPSGEQLCDIDDAGKIRLIDDQDNHCFRYYHAASRIHYGVGDWNNTQWILHFGSPADLNYIRNPMYENVLAPRSVDSLLGNLNEPWGNNVAPQIYKQKTLDPNEYDGKVWNMNFAKIAEGNEALTSTIGSIQPNIKPVLVLSQESVENGWKVDTDKNGDVKAVYNAGDIVNANIEYVRADDNVEVDYNLMQPLATEQISRERIAEQNKLEIVTGNNWVKNFKLSNPKVFNRKDGSEHEYFTAAVSKNGDELDVSRNGLVPQERMDEMVTLRGLVPRNGAHWTLSYLSGTRMVPVASGSQREKRFDPYPLLSKLDVNTLQGNTSFFLTYGLDDAGGDVYFKQLDVHIGELLKPTESKTIQSMYGNASVLFPKNSFESSTDVTVRIANVSDLPRVFEGLDPVGTIVEVLPSHEFDQSDDSKWPRVTIEVTKESLGNQDPLDVKIYKPDFKSKTIVPLEEQELGFYNAKGNMVFTCGESSGVTCHEPSDWALIKVSGKTPTFSKFMLMDKGKAALVKEEEKVVPEFACTLDKMNADTVIWAGLVNGYLKYPYPCVGESNYMIQLLQNNATIAEFQGVTDSVLKLNVRKNDFLAKVTSKDTLESRLALYDGVNKNVQVAGPYVVADSALPVFEDASVKVEDYELQKRIVVNAEFDDAESGIASVELQLYWGGKLIDSRIKASGSIIEEDFLLTKKMVTQCVGCKAEVFMTAYDYGHNYIKTSLVSEEIYPFPKSLVLWYPMVDGAGSVAKEATGTGLHLNVTSMYRPWLYGAALHFAKVTDYAKPTKTWDGVGTVPLSLEFKVMSNVSRGGTEFAILSWDANKKWLVGLSDAHDLFFEYAGQKLVFKQAAVRRGVLTHYVFTIEGKKIRLYKNGDFVEEKTLASEFVWNTKGKPVVGANMNYKSIGANLSGVRFFQAELTDEEVKDLYRGEVDMVEANLQVVRVVDLQDRENLSVDQACDLAGMAYLRQGNSENPGSVTWKVTTTAGRYNLYLLARGYETMTSAVEVAVDGTVMGTFDVNNSGVWTAQTVNGLVLSLASGDHEITITPLGVTGLAALAIANAESDLPASMIAWGEDKWTVPEPKIQVEMAYPSYSDKTWMKANFRLKNISDESLENVKIRYYYSGEDYYVAAQSFYPIEGMSIYADATDVFYAELRLPESIPVGGSHYYGNGPQIGAYRTNNNAPWNYDDDPSFDPNAVDGQFHVTDKVAVLDGEGNLISRFSCYDGTGPAKPKTPKVRALARDEGGASNMNTIAMMVENVGEIPLNGFEVRYYVRESTLPELNVYDNQFATASNITYVDGDLYYVSFKYENIILNPGEKSDYGNGVKFALHRTDGSDWDASDDASHYGLSYSFAQADSIVILDLSRNLLWGATPRPTNALPEIPGVGNYGDYVVIDPDGITVDVPDDGRYTLEMVNASGTSQAVIFSGNWSAGEHYISTKNITLISGQYIVLRKGTTILSRVYIN